MGAPRLDRVLVAQVGNVAVRGAKFNAQRAHVAKAQAIRLLGFAPCTFLIPAWGKAKGKRWDGKMKDASIKRATDALYRRPGNLAVFAEYAEKVAEMDKRWREAERQPVQPAGKIYIIKKNPPMYKPRVESQRCRRRRSSLPHRSGSSGSSSTSTRRLCRCCR